MLEVNTDAVLTDALEMHAKRLYSEIEELSGRLRDIQVRVADRTLDIFDIPNFEKLHAHITRVALLLDLQRRAGADPGSAPSEPWQSYADLTQSDGAICDQYIPLCPGDLVRTLNSDGGLTDHVVMVVEASAHNAVP